MPTIFRRSNGIYYILFRRDGKVRWVSTGKKQRSLALEVLMNYDQDRSRGQSRDNDSHPSQQMTLSQFIREFISYAGTSYSEKSARMYKSALERLSKLVGDVPLSIITSRDVDSFKASRLKQVSPVSVNIELRSLRAAFYTALRWKLISENPFKQVPMARVPEEQPSYLTREGLSGLLGVTENEWMKDLIVVAVSTGMRRGELLNLRWEDIQFPNRLIRVQSSGTFRTKSGKKRWIPMNATAFGVLSKRANGQSTEYVFAITGARIPETLVTHKFKRLVRAAGLDEKIHFHSLRHTFATWLVQKGVSIFEIQKLLGHSSIKVTQIYSHLESAQLRDTVDKICLSQETMRTEDNATAQESVVASVTVA